MRRRFCFLLLAVSAVYPALAVLSPSVAAAHSTLESSEPANGQTVTELHRIVLRFGEPVEAAGSHILIHDGREVQTLGPVRFAGNNRTLEVDVPTILDGDYTVVWHVLARDGDPVAGELTFSQTAAAAAAVTPPDAAPTPTPLPVTHVHTTSGLPAASLRLTVDLALAMLLGGLVFLAVVWPSGASVPRVSALLRASATGAALCSIALAMVQHLNADSGTWSDLLRYRFGRIALARVGLLALLGVSLTVLRRRGETAARSTLWRLGTGAVALGLLETIVLLGHEGDAGGVDGITRLVHAVGLSVWLGGLVMLLGVVLPRRQADELRAILPKFSLLATGAVGVLIAAGVLLSIDLVGAASALGGTTYGRVLLLKLAVVTVLLGAASRSRAQVHRRLGSAATGVLARWVGIELGLIALVFALTALLVSQAPPS